MMHVKAPQLVVEMGDGDILTGVSLFEEGYAAFTMTHLSEPRELQPPGQTHEKMPDGWGIEQANIIIVYRDRASVDRTLYTLQKLREMLPENQQ